MSSCGLLDCLKFNFTLCAFEIFYFAATTLVAAVGHEYIVVMRSRTINPDRFIVTVQVIFHRLATNSAVLDHPWSNALSAPAMHRFAKCPA